MGQKMMKIPIDFSLCPDYSCYYTIVTMFNYEQKFIRDVRTSLENSGTEELIEDIYIPMTSYDEKYITSKGEEKIKHIDNKLMPLYVFVKCKMTSELYSFLRNTTGCAAIMSVGNTLSIMNDSEIDKIKEKCNTISKQEAKKHEQQYKEEIAKKELSK